MAEQEELYTPTEDHFEELKSGRGKKLVARKGVPIPWEFARILGLVTTKHPKGDAASDAKPKRP